MMQLGVVGLGTMGANLARNAARCGADVAVYNRTPERTDDFLDAHRAEGAFGGCKTYQELVAALDAPRPILLMVKAGQSVDDVIDEIIPHLSSGDILIDGGNSHYRDTDRRAASLKEKGIRFLGMGVSGGEEGALHGPSMMPGGDEDAYHIMAPLLLSMAADDGNGGKCVSYMGPGGAGHFVKTVHNGIEYGVMQILAETYDVLRRIGEFSTEQLAETYESWNDSDEFKSYLLEITAKIFRHIDSETGEPMIDFIADVAGQKGTGKWTTQAAHDYGIAIPTINASVDARILSGMTGARDGGALLPEELDFSEPVPQHLKMRSVVRSAYELSCICAYQQGFVLLTGADAEEKWGLRMSEIARVWRGGCIIRSALLRHFQSAMSPDAGQQQAGMDALSERFHGERQLDWRRVVDLATSRGIPVPAMAASLTYYDALRAHRLPQSLIQAQRDFFGAHQFTRTDREGSFHEEWDSGSASV